jgi:hypothetical protein
MAWLLVGLGATIIGSEISDKYDEHIGKPISNFRNDRNRESFINDKEIARQERILDSKKKKVNTNIISSKYGIKNKDVNINNNTDNIVDIIYVNHDRGENPEKAIAWATYAMTAGFFNRTNTKYITLTPYSKIELIKLEMEEYVIVIRMNDKYMILNKSDFDTKNISVKDKYSVKNNPYNDMQCKWFW